MEDKKVIKKIFEIEVTSVIEDTDDEKKGEATIGYAYSVDTSLPELAFSVAGFLKAMDRDEEMQKQVEAGQTVGGAFITILEAYYNNKEE